MLCDEKEERRFIHPELELDSLLSTVLLLAAVLGRINERRDLELSLEGASSSSILAKSLLDPNNLGADASRLESNAWEGPFRNSECRIGVAG